MAGLVSNQIVLWQFLNMVYCLWIRNITYSCEMSENIYVCLYQHLGCVVPDCVELQEMICESCMNKTPFLWNYAANIAGNVILLSASILHLQIFSMTARLQPSNIWIKIFFF